MDIDWLTSFVQLLSILTIAVGLLLLLPSVRDALIRAYAATAIASVRRERIERAHLLARSLCKALLLNSKGRVSPLKTFLIAAVDLVLLALPAVLLISSIGIGYSDGTPDPQPQSFEVPYFKLAISSFAVHWGLEVAAALGVTALLARSPRLPPVRLFASLVGLLALVWLAPTVVGLLLMAVTIWSGLYQVAYFLIGLLFNGPNLLAVYLYAGGPSSTLLIALPLVGTLTFAAGALVVAFAYAFVALPACNAVLARLIARAGPSSGYFLIGLGVAAFGFLTDFTSSRAGLAAVVKSLLVRFGAA